MNQFKISEFDDEDSELKINKNLLIITGKIIGFYNGTDWWFREIVDRETGTEEFQFLRKSALTEITPLDKDAKQTILTTGGINLNDRKTTNRCFKINVEYDQNIPYYVVNIGFPDMLNKRCLHNLVNIKGLFLLAIGGKNDNEWLSNCEIFNYKNKQWKTFPSMNSPRSNFDAIQIGNNKVVVYGGFQGQNIFSNNLIEILSFNENDLSASIWSKLELTTQLQLPLACSKLLSLNNKLLVLGGCDQESTRKEVYEIDINKRSILKCAELTNGRTNFHVLASDNICYIVGGSFKLDYSSQTSVKNFIERINFSNFQKDLITYDFSEQYNFIEENGSVYDKSFFDPGFSSSSSLVLNEKIN